MNQFKKWSKEENKVWNILFNRQFENAKDKASRMFFEGLDKLNINPDEVPASIKTAELLAKNTRWTLESTSVQYSDGETWFRKLVDRIFIITEYIRPMDSLDYTPLPDIFHDGFGHLPFLINDELSDLVSEFAKVQVKNIEANNTKAREFVGSLWWYTVEFGLIREGSDLKAFGAGLLSSFGEIQRPFQNNIELVRLNFGDMVNTRPSPHKMHDRYFFVESLDEIRNLLNLSKSIKNSRINIEI